jgi:two-component system LytT family response regulator
MTAMEHATSNIQPSDLHRLLFIRGREIFYAQPAEIIRMEARSNYTYVYFTNHRPVLMAKVLRMYDDLLRPYGFIRTHRSHLVNAEFVDGVDRKGLIRMKDASCAEISRRKKREVYNTILHHDFKS